MKVHVKLHMILSLHMKLHVKLQINLSLHMKVHVKVHVKVHLEALPKRARCSDELAAAHYLLVQFSFVKVRNRQGPKKYREKMAKKEIEKYFK